MKIEKIRINDLKPYKNNAKIHTPEQVEQIKKSIQEFGFNDPIAVDENNMVIEGHGRLLAVKALGWTEVDCIRLDSMTDEQKRAYIHIHNQLTMNTGFDLEILEAELKNIEDIDMEFYGFDMDFEIDADFDFEATEDDFETEIPKEPKAIPGDIYQLGRHRLMCGSATSFEDVDKLLNGSDIDLIYTDPPYGMSAVSKSGVLSERYKTDIMNDGDNSVAIDSFNLCLTKFRDVKQVWWGANYYTECMPSSECWIVWDKNNGNSDQTDCELAWTNFRSVVRQFTMASEKKNRVHPTQKPCKLFGEIVNKFDKQSEFKNVLDLFGGSGSTLIACEQLDRTCYMMELDPKYVDVIISRWEQFTGEKAVLLNGD